MKYSLMDKKSADENSADFYYKLQFDSQCVLIFFVTAQSGGGGNTFRCYTKCPTSKRLGFLVALRRAGQRRDYSSWCPATIVCGPVLTAFGQSFRCEKHHHLRPKRRPCKNDSFAVTGSRHIDVLVTGATGSCQLYRPFVGANGGVIFMRGATA